MTPEMRFKARVKSLMNQSGCSLDEAFRIATGEFSQFANKADKVLKIKQQIEREMRFGQ